MQLGMFQKYQDVEISEISQHMKMVEKTNTESSKLLASVRDMGNRDVNEKTFRDRGSGFK